MEIKGKVLVVGETQIVTDKFQKRDLVIQTQDGQYTQDIKLEATQEKADLLDSVSIGDEVEVSFNLNGRGWTNKKGETSYFNTLTICKVNRLGAGAPSTSTRSSNNTDDDLPF